MYIQNGYLLTTLFQTQRNMQLASQRLSTGLRINSAADDPAGLAIVTKMKSQSRGAAIGNRNIQSARSLLQTADGAAGQLSSIAQKMKDLALQADNGTLSTADRTSLNDQMTDLKSEYDRIVTNTKFNGNNIMNSATSINVNTGNGSFSIQTKNATSGGGTVDLESLDITTQAGAQAAITKIDTAVDSISTIRSGYGSQLNALDYREDFNNAYTVAMESARSRIEDANMAEEMSNLSKNQLLHQANIQMLHMQDQLNSNMLMLLGS